MSVFLYVIVQGNDDAVKIGITKSPENRIKSIQTGNPSIVDFAFVSQPMPSAIARLVERNLHSRFFEDGMHGEWFGVRSREAVIAAQEEIARSFQ